MLLYFIFLNINSNLIKNSFISIKYKYFVGALKMTVNVDLYSTKILPLLNVATLTTPMRGGFSP